MTRNDYLKLCQRYSLNQETTVMYDGTEYYPISYEMTFKQGKPENIGVIKDLHADCFLKIRIDNLTQG